MKYIALLRGINVGGNKKVSMADWKKMMGKLGYTNIQTLLNSGNAMFESTEKDIKKLTTTISTNLEKTFGFPIPTLLRTAEQLEKLNASHPFKGITVTPETRLYVTFLSEKPTSTLKIPYVSPTKDFTILRVTPTEVCSVLVLSPKTDSTKVMGILEKEFGKNVTTRNWNTIQKMLV